MPETRTPREQPGTAGSDAAGGATAKSAGRAGAGPGNGGNGGKGDGAADAAPRRRQARGERRMQQLLDAAGTVFCQVGYTAASTNAIARAAGVSPGTLYQFFPNKEAIAVELGDRLIQRWRDSHGQAFDPANLTLPLDRLLDAVLDPLIVFNYENPAFAVLMHGPDVPGRLTQECDNLHVAVLGRVVEIFTHYLPDTPPAEVSRIANMVFALFKAGLDLILAHEGEERQAYVRELKTVMYRYLAPLVDA